MALKKPQGIDECVYYTSRDIDGGEATVWVFKQSCPKCKKALMGKPVEKGKIKARAKEYACLECGYKVSKDEYEESLTACAEYTCPSCRFKGEIEVPFKRKKIGNVKALRFQCQKCKANIDVTQKMK